MKNVYFQAIEQLPSNHSLPLKEVIEKLAFNDQDLIAVIIQDATSKAVLMMAWMNQSALEQTLATGRMIYWSRSRSAFRVKGETSGHTEELVNMSFDCDGDAILCQVKQQGAACHAGRCGCFYFSPLRPSTQAMKQSCMPRFFSSLKTDSQNFSPSLSVIHRPSNSFSPSMLIPKATCTALFLTAPS